jgi:hypothetical protein
MEDKPLLTKAEVMAGEKRLAIRLKDDSEAEARIVGVPWKRLGQLHLEYQKDPEALESAILRASLPDVGDPMVWLNWLDTESRTLVHGVCMEFAYGFQTQKKRRQAAREILQLIEQSETTSPETITPSPVVSEPESAAKPSTAGVSPP